MTRWNTFVDSLGREGGHIIVGFVLLGASLAFYKMGITKADDILVAALTILARSMGGSALLAARNTTDATEPKP